MHRIEFGDCQMKTQKIIRPKITADINVLRYQFAAINGCSKTPDNHKIHFCIGQSQQDVIIIYTHRFAVLYNM